MQSLSLLPHSEGVLGKDPLGSQGLSCMIALQKHAFWSYWIGFSYLVTPIRNTEVDIDFIPVPSPQNREKKFLSQSFKWNIKGNTNINILF